MSFIIFILSKKMHMSILSKSEKAATVQLVVIIQFSRHLVNQFNSKLNRFIFSPAIECTPYPYAGNMNG